MNKIAIVTDSNSGITQKEGKEHGIYVLPMPFTIDGKDYLEGVDLTVEEFYEKMNAGSDIYTSQPSMGSVMDLWDSILKEHDEIVHIPMSSSLSSSFETAFMLSKEYDGKVHVVDNQRISVTQKSSVYVGKEMALKGKSGEEIKNFLEETKADSSIYVCVETLKYLKKGGRITPAAAMLGEILKIKPILQIQGGKLDSFAKARTKKQAKKLMLNAVLSDFENRFGSDETGKGMEIALAYTGDNEEVGEILEEIKTQFPSHEFFVDPLSLSISCHLGPGALAIACCKKFEI